MSRRPLFAVALAMTAIALAAYAFGALRPQELSTVDARFSIRGAQGPDDRVVVVGIDQPTFAALRLQWPFPRATHGKLVDQLRRDGAKVIVLDLQFTEPSSRGEDDDLALVDAMDRAQNVVLASSEVDPKTGETPVYTPDLLRDVGARVGNSLLPNDTDGRIRRMEHTQSRLPLLGVVAAERYTGEEVAAGGYPAPIAFRGPTGTFPVVSYSDVLRGRVPASTFKDKIVVVGPTDPTLQDTHATATSGSTLMPGPELQANAISTVLDDRPLREVPPVVNVLFIVLLGLAAPLVSLRLGPGRALLVLALIGLAFAGVAQLAFGAGWIVSVVYPLLALVLSSIGTLGVSAASAAFERERVRDVFSRFVSDAVVDQVLEATDGGAVRLGGVRLQSTLLFSDLRGFTSFAEDLDPERVVEILNRYLGEMSDAILDHGGTLVAYMGDGIMAVFGAPIPQHDHADRALAAARDMLDRLERFNGWIAEQGLGDGFKMGIGLNSGMVLSGNVGSERRLEYTAIGDTTNTAARLEAMTKGTPHQLFVSDSTRAQLHAVPEGLVFVDELEVRGKQAKVKTWTLG